MRGSDETPPAVVVGLDCVTGLQATRLLADRGVPVIGIAANPRHFCARSRVPIRKLAAPTQGEGLVAALRRLGSALPGAGPAFLLPCTDAAVLTVSRERERLADQYRFVLPPHPVVERLMDKLGFAEHAMASGLPIPPTAILRSRADARYAAARLEFPVVLKPGLKTPEWLARSPSKVIRVEGPGALLQTYDRVARWTPALIAQSWVDGGEDELYSCNAYFDRRGEPQVTFVARKIRQWPPETGTSSLGIEVRDETVLATSLELFTGIGYRGLAYLEMKHDPKRGRYAMIEANVGRPTGRSAIAERGGVELLLTAYRDALDLSLPAAREQRYRGVKWIYWRHDLQAAAVALRHGRLTPREWWRSVQGPSIEAVASLRDPRPMLAELAHLAEAGSRALRRRLRGAVPSERPRTASRCSRTPGRTRRGPSGSPCRSGG
ncbi:MAG: carboxylate--amine ligase [Chloroflexi bacterium]|nr:carboxylate--amine ligase [Chloroflexota bacterium]